MADATEAGDDLVEDQQDAMLVAERAQTLQIVFRRREHAGGAGERLDDDGGDGLRPMFRDESFQRIGIGRAALRLAPRERHRGAVIGQRQMIVRTRNKRDVGIAIVGDAADRDARPKFTPW